MILKRRAEIVRAMNTMVTCINDEDLIDRWLYYGVADGDIKPGTTDEDLECYCDDESFEKLMDLFQKLMWCARNDGLYADRVSSAPFDIIYDDMNNIWKD